MCMHPDEKIRNIHERVKYLKRDRKLEAGYMTMEEYIHQEAERRAKLMAETMVKSMAETMAESMAESMAETMEKPLEEAYFTQHNIEDAADFVMDTTTD